jgi:hypothetical protein
LHRLFDHMPAYSGMGCVMILLRPLGPKTSAANAAAIPGFDPGRDEKCAPAFRRLRKDGDAANPSIRVFG